MHFELLQHFKYFLLDEHFLVEKIAIPLQGAKEKVDSRLQRCTEFQCRDIIEKLYYYFLFKISFILYNYTEISSMTKYIFLYIIDTSGFATKAKFF